MFFGSQTSNSGCFGESKSILSLGSVTKNDNFILDLPHDSKVCEWLSPLISFTPVIFSQWSNSYKAVMIGGGDLDFVLWHKGTLSNCICVPILFERNEVCDHHIINFSLNMLKITCSFSMGKDHELSFVPTFISFSETTSPLFIGQATRDLTSLLQSAPLIAFPGWRKTNTKVTGLLGSN